MRRSAAHRLLVSAFAALLAAAGAVQLIASVDPSLGQLEAAPLASQPTVARSIAPGGGPSPSTPASATPTGTGSTPAPSGSAPAPRSSPVAPAPDPNSLASGGRAEVLAARLEARLTSARVKLGMPGVSATILFPDGSAWTGTSGMADIKHKVPMRPSTAFPLASISKTFTAALILQLVDEGRLGLETSAASILPERRLDSRMTVRMLLDHTSGLADFFESPKIDSPLLAAPDARWTPERTLGYVGKPLFAPGHGYHYSNTNYLILGLIAERLTGDTVASEVRQRFFDPLDLSTASYQGAEKPRASAARGYRFFSLALTAKPVEVGDGSAAVPFMAIVTASGAAGSIAATSADVARWARALYVGNVLSPAMRLAMSADAFRSTAVDPTFRYGLGVEVLTIDGHMSLGHDGRYLGYQNAVRYFPVEGLTIAVMTNQSRTSPGLVVKALLALAGSSPVPVRPRPEAI